MSNRIVNACLELPGVSGAPRLLLFVIASRADDSGRTWQTHARLMAQMGIKSRSALLEARSKLGAVTFGGRPLLEWASRRDKGQEAADYVLNVPGSTESCPEIRTDLVRESGQNGADLSGNPDNSRPEIRTESVRKSGLPYKEETPGDTQETPSGGELPLDVEPDGQTEAPPARKPRKRGSSPPPKMSQACGMVFGILRYRLDLDLQAEVDAVVEDLSIWRAVLHEWKARGFKRSNLRGLLDWYLAGGPPPARAGRNGARPSSIEHGALDGSGYEAMVQASEWAASRASRAGPEGGGAGG